jgi:hypothetical protein
VCITELTASGYVDLATVVRIMDSKRQRWEHRLQEARS